MRTFVATTQVRRVSELARTNHHHTTMSSREDAVAVVKDACNISDERAAFYLDAAGGSAEVSVHM